LSWWHWRRLQHAGQRRAVVLELVALAPACSTLASAAPLERTGGTGAACSTLASAAPRALELVELAPACSTLAVLPVSGLQPRNRPIFFSVSGPVAGLSA